MRGIAKFYTWFWIIYFPVCIAFAVTVNFDWSDEILTVLLLLYAIVKQRFFVKDKKRMMEINIYIGLMIFYLLYSLGIKVTTPRGVFLDIMQQMRPYVVFYLTWMMAPEFSQRQQKHIKRVMLLSFFGYLFAFKFKPELVLPFSGKESAALGQIALCCAMIYYLFPSKQREIEISLLSLCFSAWFQVSRSISVSVFALSPW